MPKQLNIDFSVRADTSQARKEMQALQEQLSKLGTGLTAKSGITGMTSDIQKATQQVAQLKVQLKEATNVDTGKLDWSKFEIAMKKSGTSLETYRKSLQSLGAEGTQAFTQLARAVSNSEVPIMKVSNLFTQLGTTLKNTIKWQISSTAIHAFIGGLQSAYGYAKDLNESLNNIRIVTGQTVDQMADLANEANRTAQALGTTTTAYTDAALIYYQQGIREQEEIAKRTETTLKLANVTKQSAEEVSSQMTAIWNNFAEGSDNLELYADKITALGAATASSSAEIAEGLSKFASVADTVGLSYDYATAALATVVAQTRQSADVVGTAFKTLFGRLEGLKLGETLEDDVDLNKYSKALQAVGVEILDENNELKEMDTILDELGAKWQTIGKEQQIALAQTVGGVRQYTQLIALMDNYDKFQNNLKIVGNAKGALQEQQNIYAESWEASSKRVKAAWEDLYNKLLDDDFFIKLNNNLSETLKLVSKIIDNMGGVKGLLTQIAPILASMFSTQIITGMQDAAYNLQLMVPGGHKRMENRRNNQLKESMDNALTSVAKGGSNEKEITRLKEDIQLEQTRLKYNKELNESNQAILNTIYEQIKARKKSLEETKKEIAALEEKTQKEQNLETGKAIRANKDLSNVTGIDTKQVLDESYNQGQIFGSLVNLSNTGDSIRGNNQQISQELAEVALNQIRGIEEVNKEILKDLNVEDVKKELEQVIKDGPKKLSDATQEFFLNVSNKMEEAGDLSKLNIAKSTINPDQQNSGVIISGGTDLYGQEIQPSFEDNSALKEAIKNYNNKIEEAGIEFDKQSEALEAFKEELKNLASAGKITTEAYDKLQEAVNNESNRIQQGTNMQPAMQNSFERGSDIGGAKSENATNNKQNKPSDQQLDEIGGKLLKAQKTTTDWATSIYSVSRAFMTLNSTVSTLSNLFTTLTDKNKTFGEIVGASFQALITLGIQWGMLLRSNVLQQTKNILITNADTIAAKANAAATNEKGRAARNAAAGKREETGATNENSLSNTVNTINEGAYRKTKFGRNVVDTGSKSTGTALWVRGGTTEGGEVVKGATTTLGSIGFLVAAIAGGIKLLKFLTPLVTKMVHGDFEAYSKALAKTNEEISKWYSENADKINAAKKYDSLNAQLKNNIITTEEYNESLKKSAEALGVANVELLANANAYELLDKQTKKAQEDLEAEANLKAARAGENAKILMTAGDQDVLDTLFASPWANITGNYDNKTGNIKTIGTGLVTESTERALLNELKDLNIQGVNISRDGKVSWNEAGMSTESLAQLAEFFAKVQTNAESYGGNSNELIAGINRLNSDMSTVAESLRISANRENYENAKKIADQYGQDWFEENGFAGFHAFEEVMKNHGVSQEDIDSILSKYFSSEKQQADYSSFNAFIDVANLQDKYAEYAQAYKDLTDEEQRNFIEAAQQAPELLSSYLKGLDDSKLKSGMQDVQFILDNISLKNFETTFSIVQQTLDDLDVGQIFKTDKELENFAKKFKSTLDEFKEAYGDQILEYSDGSYAFVGDKEEMRKQQEQETLDKLNSAEINYEQNKEDLNTLLGGQSYKDYISSQELNRAEAAEIIAKGTKSDQVYKDFSSGVLLGDFMGGENNMLVKSVLQNYFGLGENDGLPPPFDEIEWSKTDDGFEYTLLTLGQREKLNAQLNQIRMKDISDIETAQSDFDQAESNIAKATTLKDSVDLGEKAKNITGWNFTNASDDIDTVQDIYNKYGGDVTEHKGTLKQASLNTAKDLGIDIDDLKEYADYLEKIEPALKNDEDASYSLALANQRLNKGIQDLHDNFDTWYKDLDKSKKGTEKYAKAMKGFEKSLQNIFNTNDKISDSFIIKHMKDIKKAADGNQKSITKLKIEYAKLQNSEAQFANQNAVTEGLKAAGEAANTSFKSVDDLFNALYGVKWEDLKINADLDATPATKALKEYILTTKMTADQAQDLLDSIGFEAELETAVDEATGITYVKSIKSSHYTGKVNKPTDKSSNKKGSSKKRDKEMKDEFERYYTINRQIQDQTDLLDHLGKAKDRAWGNAKIQLIDKESKALEKQIKLYEKKQREIESYYKKDQARMNWWGAKYDENGVVTNYKQLQERENARYNAAAKKQKKGQISEKEMDKAENRWKQFGEDLKQYDETNQLYQQHLEELNDLKNQLFDKKLEKIDTKIQMHIQVDDMELKMLEYEFDRTKKKAFSTAEAISKALSEIDIYKDEGKTYKSGINSVLKQFGISLKDIGGLSDKKISKLGLTQGSVDQLTAYADAILEDIKAIDELEETILNGPLDVMKEWNEEFDYQEDKIANNISLMKQYQNISELVYSTTPGVDDQFIYGLIESQFTQGVSATTAAQAELESNKKLLAEARASYEAALTDPTKTDQNRTQLRNNLREMEKIVQQSENNVLKSIDDTIKEAQNLLKRAVDMASDEFKKSLDVSDWDMTQFERLKTLDDQYLDDYEKIYEFSKLTRDINNSIDDADTIRQKERLREITQEIADIEASGKEVSQYEVDALRKKYELRLAEIALEDAQAAKSTVRMSRDNDGNWSYVYTADDDNVDKAVQNYEDKLYAYQKLNSEFIKKQEEDFRKLEIEAAKALSEIYSATDLKEEEKTQRAEETKAFYAQMIGISTDQLSIAIEKNSELYHKDWVDYSENTGYKISKLEDYQSSIEYTYDGVLQPTIKSATDLLDQFQTYVSGDEGFYAKLDNALKQYHTNVETVLKAANTDYKNFAKDVNAALVTTETESKKASKQVVTDTEKMEKAFEEVIAEVNKLNGQKLSKLREQLEDTYKKVQKLLGAYEKLGEAAENGNKTPKTNGKDKPSITGNGDKGTGPKKKKVKLDDEDDDDDETPAENLLRWIIYAKEYSKSLKEKASVSLGIIEKNVGSGWYRMSNETLYKKINGDNGLMAAMRTIAKILQTKINKKAYGNIPINFDTGGYTGSWGTQGRLAMLHQKELVLNAKDTENMLNTVQMVRDIVASIDTRAAAASAVNIGSGYVNNISAGSNDLNQNVHIEASFPNATDHNEIELALTNLVNRASQYAGRKTL